MTTIAGRLPLLCAATALAVVVAGCGGTASTPAAPSASTAASAKVSANTASEDEISDALDGAGVNNPERWAEEVVEYRPYPATDPNLTKLRDNLAKYNSGQATVDKIVSALTP